MSASIYWRKKQEELLFIIILKIIKIENTIAIA